MSDLFKNMLKGGESVFLNELALDYDYLPPIIKYRENQQKRIAECIQPLFQGRAGRNLIIIGSPGIGKTAAVRAVIRELESKTDDILCVYLNCWKKDSEFKLLCDLCEQIGYTWTHNKRVDELVKVAAEILNKKAVVLVFDEADKLEEQGILYTLLEDIQRKSFILITNDLEFLATIDSRVRSRMTPELLEFKPYTLLEVEGILKQRIEYAFVPQVWDSSYIQTLAKKTFDLADLRSGLYLLRESGLLAEASSVRRIAEKHVQEAVMKLSDFKEKAVRLLDDEEKNILDLIKSNSGAETKDLFEVYKKGGGEKGYRTFQRKIRDLLENKFISAKEVNTGSGVGRTRILDYISENED